MPVFYIAESGKTARNLKSHDNDCSLLAGFLVVPLPQEIEEYFFLYNSPLLLLPGFNFVIVKCIIDRVI